MNRKLPITRRPVGRPSGRRWPLVLSVAFEAAVMERLIRHEQMSGLSRAAIVRQAVGAWLK